MGGEPPQGTGTSLRESGRRERRAVNPVGHEMERGQEEKARTLALEPDTKAATCLPRGAEPGLQVLAPSLPRCRQNEDLMCRGSFPESLGQLAQDKGNRGRSRWGGGLLLRVSPEMQGVPGDSEELGKVEGWGGRVQSSSALNQNPELSSYAKSVRSH